MGKKGPITDPASLERLKLARAKGLETRKRNAIRKKEKKLLADMQAKKSAIESEEKLKSDFKQIVSPEPKPVEKVEKVEKIEPRESKREKTPERKVEKKPLPVPILRREPRQLSRREIKQGKFNAEVDRMVAKWMY